MTRTKTWGLGLLIIACLAISYFLSHRSNQIPLQTRESNAGQLQIEVVAQALERYKLHNYFYPSEELGLQALWQMPSNARLWRGPYVDPKQTTDPWGQALRYQKTEQDGFELQSAGEDQEFDTDDDLIYNNTESSN